VELFLFDTTTNILSQITDTLPGTYNRDPSISADGSRITFNSYASGYDEVVLATCSASPVIVNSNGDASDADTADGICETATPGECTLRAAIEQTNADIGAQTIGFDIPGPGPHTIALTSPLPPIADPVVIDGTTEPDFAGAPVIELDGSGAGGIGLQITSGGSTVCGLVINHFSAEAIVLQSDSNTIEGNYIGTDVAGTAVLGNNVGVTVQGSNNVIGGATGTTPGGAYTGVCNVISGNVNSGVHIGTLFVSVIADNNVVQGNYIGTDVTGTIDLGNGNAGVVLLGNSSSSVSGNLIGGTTPAARNIISANKNGGVGIAGLGGSTTTTNNMVQGNYIGTDVTGTAALGNNNIGVGIVDGASNNMVGGTTSGAGNIIAYNGSGGGFGGVVVGLSGTGNSILSNSIFSNTGLGIDLGGDAITPDGITLNDPGDSDTGPNNLQNYPLLSLATGGVPTIEGTLNSTFFTSYRIEFFSNDTCDPSGNGEGEMFLGSTSVTTDGSGNASFLESLGTTLPVGQQFITATATDPDGNTSEFSACIEVTGIDADGDGIVDEIDTQPTAISNDFFDGIAPLTGTTSGTITARGDRVWRVLDEPGNGVRVTVGGGIQPATLDVTGVSCIPAGTISIPPTGTDFNLACASATIEVLSGSVTFTTTVDDKIVEAFIGAGAKVTFELVDPVTMIITLDASSTTSVDLLVNGESVTLSPGESFTFQPIQQQIQDTQNLITALSTEALNGSNNRVKEIRRNTLLKKLDYISDFVSNDDFQTAIDELRNLLEKTDNIAPPDSSPDWVVDDPATVENEQEELA